MTRIVGLDLGQAHDPAAAAVCDRQTEEPPEFIGSPNPNFKPRLLCRDLREWPLGTDYTQIVTDTLDVPQVDFLVVDFGGVGRPVVDMLRRDASKRNYRGRIIPVQLIGSAGRAASKQEARGRHWNIPKIDIVTSLTIAQQKGSLVLPAIPETGKLLLQLREFQMKFTKAANLQFGNAPGGHDDILIALALCTWWDQRFGTLKPAVYC